MDQTPERPADLYARPEVDDPAVQGLLAELAVKQPCDLGGTMSLNLHLEELGMVLRVHPRFESVARLRSLRTLRAELAGVGLRVGVPRELLGEDIRVVGNRLAEAEAFVPAEKPQANWEAYLWMFQAMGRLHRAINTSAASVELQPPEVATYAWPAELRRWMVLTRASVARDRDAASLADEVHSMVEALEGQWTPAEQLPQQVIHGDIRLGNVARTPDGDTAYFDFGFAARRPRIHDLAYSLFWIVLKQDESGRAEDFDWRRTAELFEAYEVAAGDRLSDLERRAIGPYLAAVPMYFVAIASYTPDPCDRIKQEFRSLAIARWVLAHPTHLFV